MANIRVNLTEPLLNGMDIKFKAPCDCTAVTGLEVYAPDNDGNMAGQTFTFKDAHGNTLTGVGNLFEKNALVKVMVDTDTSSAYIQNADTNKYLEDKIANAGTKVTLSSSVSSTSTTTAANSYAVKQAYDKAAAATTRTGTQFPVTVSDVKGASNVTLGGGVVYTKTYGDIIRCIVDFKATVTTGETEFGFNIHGLPSADFLLGVTPATFTSTTLNTIAGVCSAVIYSGGTLGIKVRPIELAEWKSDWTYRAEVSYVKS